MLVLGNRRKGRIMSLVDDLCSRQPSDLRDCVEGCTCPHCQWHEHLYATLFATDAELDRLRAELAEAKAVTARACKAKSQAENDELRALAELDEAKAQLEAERRRSEHYKTTRNRIAKYLHDMSPMLVPDIVESLLIENTTDPPDTKAGGAGGGTF